MTTNQKQKICETCSVFRRMFMCPTSANQAQPWYEEQCPRNKWATPTLKSDSQIKYIKLLTHPDRKTGNPKIDDILTQYAIALEEAETSDKGCTPCKKGALIREYMQKLKLAGV